MNTHKKLASSGTNYDIPNTLHQAQLVVQQIAQTQIYSLEPILDLMAATGQNGDGRTFEFLLWGWMMLKVVLKLLPSYYSLLDEILSRLPCSRYK